MQSEDLQLLLRTLQDSQSQRETPLPVQTPNSLDHVLRELHNIHHPAPAQEPVPGPSTTIGPDTSLPQTFETYKHARDDPLDNDDEDNAENYSMPEPPPKPDLRQCSYVESLPILGDLCSSDSYLNHLRTMKKTQEEWEIRTLHRRHRILAGIRKSTHTVKDLRDHDLETLKLYDELQVKQQQKLEEIGTPVFSVSQEKEALQKQRRVMQTLEMALIDTEERSKQIKESQ